MVAEYKNTMGDIYYVKAKITSKGNTSYFLTKKKDESCIDILPDAYEVFEKYDTKLMYIRKKKENFYTSEEIQKIKTQLETNKKIYFYKLDIYGELIRIYIVETEEMGRHKKMLKETSFDFSPNIINLFTRYDERIQIKGRIESGKKSYVFYRFCYRGSIDDWISIAYGSNLGDLAKEVLQHLGKESYYELF